MDLWEKAAELASIALSLLNENTPRDVRERRKDIVNQRLYDLSLRLRGNRHQGTVMSQKDQGYAWMKILEVISKFMAEVYYEEPT